MSISINELRVLADKAIRSGDHETIRDAMARVAKAQETCEKKDAIPLAVIFGDLQDATCRGDGGDSSL